LEDLRDFHVITKELGIGGPHNILASSKILKRVKRRDGIVILSFIKLKINIDGKINRNLE